MKKPVLLLVVLFVWFAAPAAQDRQAADWQREAANVSITRDNWGIAHVHGKTDADAVFGMIYAQAEDDFNRVETNYLNSMGRLAEAEGEAQIYRDLRMRLFVDPVNLESEYEKSPQWLKALMNAWADGLNYYLATHPKVKPRVITRFEPWMALSFTEGSIGGDIEKIDVNQLAAFYGKRPTTTTRLRSLEPERASARQAPPASGFSEPSGSNGAAIAPSNTVNHQALLLINPHTSFFFRSELQMTSDDGLDAYGAVTWGQFFIYQGFNARAGWMHTSSGVDDVDEYLETVTKKGDGFFYRYGSEERPVQARRIVVPYKTATGMAQKEFTVYRTQHGPVVREMNGKWVSVSLMREPVKSLMQSYTRTRASGFKAFRETMELHTNSSNNTIYADADGNIAYFHANFIPRRDTNFDWTKPVDGSDPATDWKGLLSVDETPHLLNPASGWLYNSNNWPWSAAGASSPKRADYPVYVDKGTEETPRGFHALRVLDNRKDFTLDSLIGAAYDSYLPAFDTLLPPLFKAYDALAVDNPLKAKVSEQIGVLRAWDRRWSVSSVATSLAQYWGDRAVGRGRGAANPEELVQALAAASDKLTADFGTWKTPWGQINRYQRLTGDIVQQFNDAAPSIPVGFTSSRWGSLASFGARAYPASGAYPGTKKMYGTSGNSFVAVVEFGDRVRAKAVSAGGESGDPSSPHFSDQATPYAMGNLREVFFYPDQLKGHIERQYHPGQ